MPQGTMGLTWAQASAYTWATYPGTWGVGQGTGSDAGTLSATESRTLFEDDEFELVGESARADVGSVSVDEALDVIIALDMQDEGVFDVSETTGIVSDDWPELSHPLPSTWSADPSRPSGVWTSQTQRVDTWKREP